ncbi:MAG TPA: glycosyltransferase family 39 protein [Baekduia sp.]|nr:glycosyltransferase family 39 protein [Baekduia sp.]
MRPPESFRARLLLIAAGALLLRLVYAGLNRGYPVVGDALTFHFDAAHLAAGQGFMRPFEAMATAEHPPLQIVLLGLVDWLGGHGTLPQRFVECFIGTGTVILLGLLGRAVAGPRAGLIAAGLGAVYPMLWMIDGSLMSETPYLFLVTATLVLAYRHRAKPSTGLALAIGALIALAALTRGEAIGLLVLLVLPLAWHAGTSWRPRLRTAALMGAAFCVVLAPWTIRNLATFERPVLISTNSDTAIAGANCPGTYYGELLGSWDYNCLRNRPPGDESEFSAAYRDRGVRYIKAHLDRVPVVVGVRLLRQLDLYRPTQSALLQASEGRRFKVALWGIRWYWGMLALAIAGAVLLRRRRAPMQILAAPVALAFLVAVFVYGSTRLRVVMEPVIVVCAAVAVEAAWRRLVTRRASSAEASSAAASPTATRVSAGISQSQSIEAWKA